MRAVVTKAGSLVRVLLRRTSPRDCYAGVYDPQQKVLRIVRRSDADLNALEPLLP